MKIPKDNGSGARNTHQYDSPLFPLDEGGIEQMNKRRGLGKFPNAKIKAVRIRRRHVSDKPGDSVFDQPHQRAHPDMRDRNREQFHSSAFGEMILPFYEQALTVEPSLSRIAVARDDNALPGASRSFVDRMHHITLPLAAETPNTLLSKVSEEGLAHIAHSIGMKPEELANRPELLLIHATLHELAHTVLYMRYDNKPEEYNARSKREIDGLPIPGENVISELIPALDDPNSKQSIWIREHWSELEERYGVKDIEELLVIQRRAKANLYPERFADGFAAHVMKTVLHKK